MGLTKANGEALLSKPYRAEDVVRALEIVEQIVSTGEATQPFPQRVPRVERLIQERYGVEILRASNPAG